MTTVYPSRYGQPPTGQLLPPPGGGETASLYCGRLVIKRGGARVKRDKLLAESGDRPKQVTMGRGRRYVFMDEAS